MAGGIISFIGLFLFFMGVATILSTFKLSLSSSAATIALLLGIIMISVGSYLVFITISWYVIFKKLVGLIMLIFGYFLIFLFPGEKDYQPEGYTMIGVIAGIFFFIVGLYLVIF